jgi:hypothetical protein
LLMLKRRYGLSSSVALPLNESVRVRLVLKPSL